MEEVFTRKFHFKINGKIGCQTQDLKSLANLLFFKCLKHHAFFRKILVILDFLDKHFYKIIEKKRRVNIFIS